MTDCNQLPAAYDDTQAQLDSIPGWNNPIAYCNARYPDPEDHQRVLSCLSDIRSRARPLEQQLALLNYEMEICSALLGTWTWKVPFTDMLGLPHTATLTLQITSWDTAGDGNWTGTLIITEESGESVTTAIPGMGNSGILAETSLQFNLTAFPGGFMGPYLHCVGHLNMQMNPPVIDQAFFTDSSGDVQPFVATKIG